MSQVFEDGYLRPLSCAYIQLTVKYSMGIREMQLQLKCILMRLKFKAFDINLLYIDKTIINTHY